MGTSGGSGGANDAAPADEAPAGPGQAEHDDDTVWAGAGGVTDDHRAGRAQVDGQAVVPSALAIGAVFHR